MLAYTILTEENKEKNYEEELCDVKSQASVAREKISQIYELLQDITGGSSNEITESIIRLVCERNMESTTSAYQCDFEEAATFILGEFGIPAHTKGYRYLRDAIVLVAQKPLLVDGITKRLYPVIAENYSTTSVRVERVIRHAIESGCTKGDTQALYHYFPHSISEDKMKPTNAEFIAVMGDIVKMRVSKRQLVFAEL